MASQAEIDLIVDASNTLPQITRDLTRIVRVAEDGADTIDLDVALAQQQALRTVAADLDRVVTAATSGADDIDLNAVLNQTATIARLQRDLDGVISSAQRGVAQDPVQLRAVLNSGPSLVAVRGELDRVITRAQRGLDDIDIDVDVDTRRATTSVRSFTPLLMSLTENAGRAARSAGDLGLGLARVGVAAGAAVPLIAGAAAAIQSILPAAAVATTGMVALGLVSGAVKIGMIGVKEAIATAFDPEASPEDLAKAMANLSPEAAKTVTAISKLKDEFKELRLDVQERLFDGLSDSVDDLGSSVLPQMGNALGKTADSLNLMAKGAASAAVDLAETGVLGTALESANKGILNLSEVPALAVTAFGQLAAAAGPSFERVTEAAAKSAEGIAESLTNAFESGALEEAIDEAINLIDQLGDIGGDILGGLANIFGGLTTNGRDFFDILEEISQAFEELTASSEFQSILNELALTADALVKNVLPLLLTAFKELAPVIEELGPPIRDFINEIGPELIPVLQDLGPILVDIAKILREQMPFAIEVTKQALKLLEFALGAIHKVLDGLVLPIVRKIVEIFNSDLAVSIRGVAQNADEFFGAAGRAVGSFRDSVARSMSATLSNIIGFISGLRQQMVQNIASLLARVVNYFRDLPGRIRGGLGNLGGLLVGVGASIVQGLINGIRSKIGGVIEAAAAAANAVKNGIKNLLSIRSPSRVTFGFGVDTMTGFEGGIESRLPDLRATISQVAAVIPQTLTQVSSIGQRFNTAEAGAPAVYVTIGNQAVDQYVTTRVEAVDRRNIRTTSQGVRR